MQRQIGRRIQYRMASRFFLVRIPLTIALNPYLDTSGGCIGSSGPALSFAPDRPLPPEVAAAYVAVTPRDMPTKASRGVPYGAD